MFRLCVELSCGCSVTLLSCSVSYNMEFDFDDDVERAPIVKSSKKGSKAGKPKRRNSPSLRSLDSLPDELLVDIFLFISPSSLLAIGLVSKRFNAVSEESWRQKCLVKYQSVRKSPFLALSCPSASLSFICLLIYYLIYFICLDLPYF